AHRTRDGEPMNIVHRDVAPANVLLSADGRVKLGDFGIARAEQRITQTRTGLLKGRLEYMAPEVAQLGAVDGRADVFSAVALLFELLSGRPIRDAAPDTVLLERVRSQSPLDLGQRWPGMPQAFAAFFAEALALDPTRRLDAEACLRRLGAVAAAAYG